MRQHILAGIILSLSVATSDAALLGRAPLTPGGTDYQAYYDTDLNITWLGDWNYARTSGYDDDGLLTFGEAQYRLTYYWNVIGILELHDWRLPTVTDSGLPGCQFAYVGTDCGYNVATGELAHLYYVTLGNIGTYDSSGTPTGCGFTCITNPGPFANFTSEYTPIYWYGTLYAPFPENDTWIFDTLAGSQEGGAAMQNYFRVALVSPGDQLAPVPIPAVGWLLGAALGVLGWARRNPSASVSATTTPIES